MDKSNDRIDLNLADADTLATLKSIGPALAARIIEFREGVHPFEEVIELAAVPGISERMVREIADDVVVGPPARAGDEGAETPEESPAADLTEPAFEELDVLESVEPEGEPVADVETEPSAEEVEGEATFDAAELAAPDLATTELGQADDAVTDSFDEIESAAPDTTALEPGEGDDSILDTIDAISLGRPDIIPDEDTGDGEAMAEVAGEPLVVLPSEAEPAERPAPAAYPELRTPLVALTAGLVGALIGLGLSLIILYIINGGTLRFATAESAGNLERELAREVTTARQEREGLGQTLDALGEQADALTNEASALVEQQAELQEALEDAQGDISSLEDTAEELDGQIREVAAAAENFNAFLDGLRDLLIDLQGEAPTPSVTATPSAESTPVATPSTTVTPELRATTSTPRPATRTPRPTATPLIVPLATPTS